MATPVSGSRIVISFKDQSEEVVYFKVRRETQIVKVLKSYCEEKQVVYGTLDFYLDGNRLARRGTVAQGGLKDKDVIDVLAPADGGGAEMYLYSQVDTPTLKD